MSLDCFCICVYTDLAICPKLTGMYSCMLFVYLHPDLVLPRAGLVVVSTVVFIAVSVCDP